MSESFLNGRVVLHAGDSREVLKTIADNSIDSIVTDPPYALVSIVKRFGGNNAAPVKVPEGGSGAYARASSGFMGKQWDTGETAFATEFWQQCLRVLKPGGHVVAFSGTRTYHRMACAIEDAGFEIRDQLQWVYGSGFPKSHDVSKGIDRAALSAPLFDSIREHVRLWRDTRGFDNVELAEKLGLAAGRPGMVRHWTSLDGGQHQIPSKDQWRNLKRVLEWPACEFDSIYDAVKDGAERPVLGQRDATLLAVAPGQDNDRSATSLDITAPATAYALQWQGWGTALKPACEPICFGRKPLSEKTVAANVLAHGVGAINIDGCRVSGPVGANWSGTIGSGAGRETANHGAPAYGKGLGGIVAAPHESGRWPANLLHDGSDEVLAGFPDLGKSTGGRIGNAGGGNVANLPTGAFEKGDPGFGDSGSAARFFYSAKPDAPGAGAEPATSVRLSRGSDQVGRTDGSNPSTGANRFFYTSKADSDDRLGSKHPTVKPVDLMQWLCRLVTPKGGTVLDPFAGTGTTGEAAFREGFNAVLIERELEYQADIRRRMALVLSGPDERARESIKARLKDAPIDHGPLFGGLDPIAEAAE